MPVIVIGADSRLGTAILGALLARGGEVRAFVSDPIVGEEFKQRHAKVAVGDLSDESHVEGAAAMAYSAVLVTESASDGRELSFADTPREVLAGWARALRAVSVQRAIWVTDVANELDPEWISATPEHAVLHPGRTPGDIAEEVARLDEAEAL